MTDKNLTEIIVIADRSASMSDCQKETIQGFNAFLKDQQNEKTGKCVLTYTQFNTDYDIKFIGRP